MTKSPSSEASHDSGDDRDDGQQSSKTPTLKDKECQYCHQKFTSSSLGRHLDQFVSKKKPDGVHDVDEIRRLRGGITRRTARNSKKEQDDTNSTQHSPSPQYTLPSYSELLNKTTSGSSELRFNRMNWQATGVITDPTNLNPPTANVVSPSIANPPTNTSGTKRNFSTYASDLPALNPVTSETTRALELSLREVLDTVRTATKKAAPAPQPFPFDFAAQTFPYLCLALLPTPATLFTPTPFATSASLSLSPPGLDQYQTLRQNVESKIDEWKWARLAYKQRTSAAPFSEEMDDVEHSASAQSQAAMRHLDAAYQSFMSFPPESRQNLWTVEILRAFKTEQQKTKDANARVERLVQETNRLQQQIDHLSRCQWPREMALWPPDRVILSERTRDALGQANLIKDETSGMIDGNNENTSSDQQRNEIDRWDYDTLVSKWKKHVREDRSRRTGIQPSMSLLPGAGPPPPADTHMPAPSEPSTVSTPRIPSNLAKSTMADYRSGSTGQTSDSTSLHNSPVINGVSGAPGVTKAQDLRRRNIFVSDMDDIFTPRLQGLRAGGIVESATP